MELNEILKTRRDELRLTLDDIAKFVGVSAATVSRWESGEIKNLRRDKIAKLAEVLQCKPSYLLGWSDENDNVTWSTERKIKNDGTIVETSTAHWTYDSGDTTNQKYIVIKDDILAGELFACYGEVKEHFDESDLEDIKLFMRMKAERKRQIEQEQKKK